MLINKPGAEFLYNGITYRVGDVIIGSDQSEYAGLIGSILEIRDGDDKETENDTPDIYCSFEPPVLPADIAKVEAVFSDLYDEKKEVDDICFDMVIMAPEMIIVPGQSKKAIKLYILSEDWAAHTVIPDIRPVFIRIRWRPEQGLMRRSETRLTPAAFRIGSEHRNTGQKHRKIPMKDGWMDSTVKAIMPFLWKNAM